MSTFLGSAVVIGDNTASCAAADAALHPELGPVGAGVAGGRQLAAGQVVGIAGGEHVEVLAGDDAPAAIADLAVDDHRREAVALRQNVVLQGEQGISTGRPGPPFRPLEGRRHRALLGREVVGGVGVLRAHDQRLARVEHVAAAGEAEQPGIRFEGEAAAAGLQAEAPARGVGH